MDRSAVGAMTRPFTVGTSRPVGWTALPSTLARRVPEHNSPGPQDRRKAPRNGAKPPRGVRSSSAVRAGGGDCTGGRLSPRRPPHALTGGSMAELEQRNDDAIDPVAVDRVVVALLEFGHRAPSERVRRPSW